MEISKEAIELLMTYDWKGNIRELENIIERLVILSQNNVITVKDLPKNIQINETNVGAFELPKGGINLEEVEKSLILQALTMSDNNQTKAAELLGISRHTLIYRMEKYRIK